MNNASGLLGKNPFDHAKINEWIAWAQTTWLPRMHPASFAIFGYGRPDEKKFAEDVKAMKEAAKILDGYLKGKHWLVGDTFSLADIFVGSYMLSAFQCIFDAGFRKAMPNLSAWFEKVTHEPSFVKRFGHVKACKKSLKPGAGGPPGGKPAGQPKAEAKKEEKAADDDLDLFGDDDEADAAAAKAVAEKAKAAKDGKKKKEVIAQSLVLYEVKPLDDTTDLDELAARILGIKMDGLYWKTEYKKEPVAFGIFKLVIGVTVEDEKVSVDGLQEKIEEFEDMV